MNVVLKCELEDKHQSAAVHFCRSFKKHLKWQCAFVIHHTVVTSYRGSVNRRIQLIIKVRGEYTVAWGYILSIRHFQELVSVTGDSGRTMRTLLWAILNIGLKFGLYIPVCWSVIEFFSRVKFRGSLKYL